MTTNVPQNATLSSSMINQVTTDISVCVEHCMIFFWNFPLFALILFDAIQSLWSSSVENIFGYIASPFRESHDIDHIPQKNVNAGD